MSVNGVKFEKFEPWSGAVDAFNRIYNEGDMDAVDFYIDDLYPDGISEGTLNDWLWFDPEDLYRAAGLAQCPKCEDWFRAKDLDLSDDPYDLEEYCEDCLEKVNEEYYNSLEDDDEDDEDEEEDEEEEENE